MNFRCFRQIQHSAQVGKSFASLCKRDFSRKTIMKQEHIFLGCLHLSTFKLEQQFLLKFSYLGYCTFDNSML